VRNTFANSPRTFERVRLRFVAGANGLRNPDKRWHASDPDDRHLAYGGLAHNRWSAVPTAPPRGLGGSIRTLKSWICAIGGNEPRPFGRVLYAERKGLWESWKLD
jgi:hypothetical protein